MAKFRTHYDNLQVSRKADSEVIRAAYRSLAQKYHPDRHPNSRKEAERIMRIINHSFDILSDPIQRKKHDERIEAKEKEYESINDTIKSTQADHQNQEVYVQKGIFSNRETKDHLWSFVDHLSKWFVVYLLIIIAGLVFSALHFKKDFSPKTAEKELSDPIPPDKARIVTTDSFSDISDKEIVDELIRRKLSGKTLPIKNRKMLEEIKRKLLSKQKLTDEESKFWKTLLAKPDSLANIPSVKKEKEKTEVGKFHQGQELELKQKEKADTQREKAKTDFPINTRSVKAPNGPERPISSGYIGAALMRFTDGLSKLNINNSANETDFYLKLCSLDQVPSLIIREIFIKGGTNFTIDTIRQGTYYVRYKNLDTGGCYKSQSFQLVEEPTPDGGIKFSETTITLYKVPFGKFRTYPISEKEF